jgi:hypothetical protein
MDRRGQTTGDLGSSSPCPSPVAESRHGGHGDGPGWSPRAPPVPEDEDFVANLGRDAPSTNSKSLDISHHTLDGPESVQVRAAREGKRNVVRLLRFLAKMMVPISVIALVMFAMFALLSWSIPHVLCNSTAKALSGSSIGIYECIYVSDGDYVHVTPSKIFWLLFWSVQTAWVAIFPGFIAYTLFGSCVSGVQRVSSAVVAAGCFVTPMVTSLVYGMALNNYIVLAVSAGGAFLVNIICASSAVRYCKDPLMKWRWITLFMIAGQVNTIYLFVMPRLLTLRSADTFGGMGLTVVRVVVHPLIWASVLFLFRSVQRHIGSVDNLKQTAFMVWPILYSTLYGRFLLLQLEDAGSIIMINFLFACVQLGLMIQGRGTDVSWLGWLYGKRARDAMGVSMEVDTEAMAFSFTFYAMEMGSILAASALLSFGSIAALPGLPPDSGTIWFNAFVQLATTVLFSSLEFMFGNKFHNYEWSKVYPRSISKLLLYVLPVLIIGGSRLCVELLMLFCPKHYDEHGILLEQCDKETLFSTIRTKHLLARPTYQTVDGGEKGWFEFGQVEL